MTFEGRGFARPCEKLEPFTARGADMVLTQIRAQWPAVAGVFGFICPTPC